MREPVLANPAPGRVNATPVPVLPFGGGADVRCAVVRADVNTVEGTVWTDVGVVAGADEPTPVELVGAGVVHGGFAVWVECPDEYEPWVFGWLVGAAVSVDE